MVPERARSSEAASTVAETRQFPVLAEGVAEVCADNAADTVSLVDGGTLEMNHLVNHASADLAGHLRPMAKPAAPWAVSNRCRSIER